MRKNGGDSDLGRFIIDQTESYNAIFEAIKSYTFRKKSSLDFRDEYFNKGYITLEEIAVKFTENIAIDIDSVKFDAIIDASFSMSKKYQGDFVDATESLWFRSTCYMVITDKLAEFKVTSIVVYSKEKYKNITSPATANFVPIISKCELDNEATVFLGKYYPDALKTPMAVPVREIAAKLNLTIIDGYHISKNNKIFGAICFRNCKARLYDANWSKVGLSLKAGSIIVDSDIYFWGNIGCENNTIAHELFHWYRHRLYAKIQHLLDKNYIAACRCNKQPNKGGMYSNDNSDSDWMEWQANSVAPKILMPKLMFLEKMNEYFISGGIDKNNIHGQDEQLFSVISKLADFFKVSIQSTIIRMSELGVENLDTFYNNKYNFKKAYEIEPIDYYFEYKNNLHFRELIDKADFLYVENLCIINSDKYININSVGKLQLTDYAKEHKEECCLQFSERIILNRKRLQELSLLFFRGAEQSYAKCKNLADDILNDKVINNAKVSPKATLQKAKEFEERVINALVSDIAKCITNIIEIYKVEWNFDEHKIIAEIESVTLISKKTLSDIKLGKSKPKKETLIAFGVGLGLGYNITTELLKRAGHTLINSEEDFAYTMILTGYRQSGIDSANILLENFGIKHLGNLE